MSHQTRALFFDRDGIVNVRLVGDYVRSPEQLVIIPDIFDALRRTVRLGFLPILVTNQRGIARGLMSVDDLERIHTHLQDTLRREGAPTFHAIYYCPHGVDKGCDCRKPEPGMLLRAFVDYSINPEESWMIGDSPSDVEAGRRAGCRTVLVGPEGQTGDADVVAQDLKEAIDAIEASPGQASTGVVDRG